MPERSLASPPNDYNFSHSPNVGCGDEEVDLSYKVPLTAQQEQRAQRLYRKSFVILGEKAKANQATNTFAVRAGVGNRLAAGCANSCANSLLRIYGTHAVRMR
jgi:hypothetical protein